jgi:hypothetical protein
MRFTTAALLLRGATLISSLPIAISNGTSTIVTLDYTTLVPTAGNDTLGHYEYQKVRFAATLTGYLRCATPQWSEQGTEINSGGLVDASVACSSVRDRLFMDV